MTWSTGLRNSKLYLPTVLFLLVAAAFEGYRYHVSLGQALVTSPLSAPFDPALNASRRAYATCLYNEGYLPGAILLGWSLQKHGMLAPDVAQHMILMHTPGSLRETALARLVDVGWEMREVEHVPYPLGREPARNFLDQYTKLRLFELEEFDQIFYLDADTLVYRPFPEIWSYPAPLAAARDVRKGFGWLPTMNAGTLLLKPNRAVFDHMLEIAPVFQYNTVFAEQGLLNAYWAQAITFLPYIYNGQLGIKRVFPEVWEVFKHDMKIIHFTGLKPWEWYEEPDMPVERAIWWEAWEEMARWREEIGLETLGSLGRKAYQGASGR